MNQILRPEEPDNLAYYHSQFNLQGNNKNSNQVVLSNYKVLFLFSAFIAFICICIFLIRLYQSSEEANLSQDLLSAYHVSTLYANNIDYSTQSTTSDMENLLPNSYQLNTSTPFVIGMIRIDKINVNYSILSHTNRDSLKISLCRFAGPMPNEVGNLCIAGHNYVDYKFFSRLNELELEDKIKIYDLTGTLIEYKIFDIYETKPDNLNCTSQDTDGKKIVTLLTCNNVNGRRLVVKAESI